MGRCRWIPLHLRVKLLYDFYDGIVLPVPESSVVESTSVMVIPRGNNLIGLQTRETKRCMPPSHAYEAVCLHHLALRFMYPPCLSLGKQSCLRRLR